MDEKQDTMAQLERNTELFAFTIEKIVDARAAAAKALLMARVRNIEECKDHLRLITDILDEILGELRETVIREDDNG